MPDYGHDLLFGTFPTPRAEQAEQVLALAELTERVGQDQPYQPAPAGSS